MCNSNATFYFSGTYAKVLQPPVSKCDITYWLNKLSHDNTTTEYDNRPRKWSAINTAGKDVNRLNILSKSSLVLILIFPSLF